MKYCKLLIPILLIAILFTGCNSITGEGEKGEGSTTETSTKTYDTSYEKEAGLYNATTGKLKYSWAELETRGYVTVEDTCLKKAVDYIRGVLYIPTTISSIGSKAFSGCTGLNGIYISNGVTIIDTKAFSGCTGLDTVVFGANITNIASDAFANCTKFTEITIPNLVTNIGNGAFEGCTGLKTVVIGSEVTNISGSAFKNCTGLTSVTLYNKITYIGSQAFDNCTNLSSVKYEGTKAQWYSTFFAKDNDCLTDSRITLIDGTILNNQQ